MDKRLVISLEDFPEAGKHLNGQLDGSLFAIDDEDTQSASPLNYDLSLQAFGNELFIQGCISACFRFRCVRCLSSFELEEQIDDFSTSIDIENKLAIDISEELREELLLDLPHYPKCELVGQECKINEDFADFRLDKDPQPEVESSTPSTKGVWDALDQFPNQQD